MNNEVTFSIKIVTEGQEKLVQVTANAKELGTAVETVTAKTGEMSHTFLDMNQHIQVFNALRDGMSQIMGVTQQLTDKYASAEIANTKLTTVMRQRMGAQEDDVASVKAVIAEQKELGVVSGTVQTR